MQKFFLAALAATTAMVGVAATAQAPERGPSQRAPERAELTRAQAQERAVRVFDRIDANKDGQLDQADRAARQRARFDRLDTDSDGAISFEEFSAVREARTEARTQARAEQRNRPGAERRVARAPRPGRLAMALRTGDGDRVISRDEFTSRALARFDRLDADKDGTVTAEERQAARRTLREMRRAPAAG